MNVLVILVLPAIKSAVFQHYKGTQDSWTR